MRVPNLPIILVFGFLAGGILSSFGFIIKKFNAGDIVNFYDERKYDKSKVSKVVGGNFLIIGDSVIVLSLLSIFINKSYYLYVTYILVVIILLGLLITTCQFFTKCKK